MQAKPSPRHAAGLALLATGLAGGLSSPAAGGTLAVPGDYPTIQIAINIAVTGDEVVVAPGMYFETLDLGGKAITLRSSGGPDVTTVNAFGQFDSAIHAISGEGPDTVLEGLTFTGGDATFAAPEDRGGGLYINGSSPTVINCIFTLNDAIVGGGVYCNGGSPTFTDCQFLLNAADLGGGAYFNASTIDIVGSTFQQNDAVVGQGGAIRAYNGTYSITDSTFTQNTAINWGGALDLANNLSVAIERCRFLGNFCSDGGSQGRGGAIAGRGTTIKNSIFVANNAHMFGGALYSTNAASPMTVHNCTFLANVAGAGNSVVAGNVATSVVNCIAWGNTMPDPVNGNAVVSYSNIEASDPMFVNAGRVDLHLQAGSPAIDAGNTSVLTGSYPVDLDGELRAVNDPDTLDIGVPLLNLAVDMGAYEFQPSAPVSACPADLDGDDQVGITDFLQLLGAWGACP